MRVPASVYVGLVVASVVVSTILWRDLRTAREALQTGQQALQAERQLTDTLRTQLAQARAAPAPSPPVQTPVVATPQPAVIVKTSSDVAALVADVAKRQKALLENSDSHKGRLAEVRASLKQRNPVLARELGISEQEADAIFDILAEGQLRQEAQVVNLAASGTAADPAAVAEMTRNEQAQQQEQKDTLVSMLGTARYEQLQDIEQTQQARTRVVNMTTLLTQSGQPLTSDQTLSLTKVMADEEKREEKESQDIRASGQPGQVSPVDRAVAGDRRILDAAADFLNTQQLATVRARFEQRQAMERASGIVQSRERQPTQQSPD